MRELRGLVNGDTGEPFKTTASSPVKPGFFDRFAFSRWLMPTDFPGMVANIQSVEQLRTFRKKVLVDYLRIRQVTVGGKKEELVQLVYSLRGTPFFMHDTTTGRSLSFGLLAQRIQREVGVSGGTETLPVFARDELDYGGFTDAAGQAVHMYPLQDLASEQVNASVLQSLFANITGIHALVVEEMKNDVSDEEGEAASLLYCIYTYRLVADVAFAPVQSGSNVVSEYATMSTAQRVAFYVDQHSVSLDTLKVCVCVCVRECAGKVSLSLGDGGHVSGWCGCGGRTHHAGRLV